MDVNDDLNELSPYEENQIAEIRTWKVQEPNVVSKAFGVAIEPLAWLVQKTIPEAAIKGALDFGNLLAKKLADIGDIKKAANIDYIFDLKTKDLKLSDELADGIRNWAVGVAAAEGLGAGLLGIFGMPIDIPTIITIALRSIHKIGMCYGYEVNDENDQNFIYGIFSSAGANSIVEKQAALAFLKDIELAIARQTWKVIAEKAAQQQIGKEAGIMVIKNLARQLGINITKRKALAAIPVIGAAIGGSVNAWYIKDVSNAAKRAFQERWLIDNHKIIEI